MIEIEVKDDNDVCIEVRNEAMNRAMVKYDGHPVIKPPYLDIYMQEINNVLSEPGYRAMQDAWEEASIKELIDAQKERRDAYDNRFELYKKLNPTLTPLPYKTSVNTHKNIFLKTCKKVLTYITNKFNVKS